MSFAKNLCNNLLYSMPGNLNCLTTNQLSTNVCSGLLYAVPRTLNYLTTNPPSTDTKIYRVRKEAFEWSQIFIKNFGEENWNLFMDLAIDNAWLSHLAISFLLKNNTTALNIKKIILMGLTYLGVGSTIWLTRLAIVKGLKTIGIKDVQIFNPRTLKR